MLDKRMAVHEHINQTCRLFFIFLHLTHIHIHRGPAVEFEIACSYNADEKDICAYRLESEHACSVR